MTLILTGYTHGEVWVYLFYFDEPYTKDFSNNIRMVYMISLLHLYFGTPERKKGGKI